MAFSDASCEALGVVIFLKNLSSGKVSFLLTKNRLVGASGVKRSMPTLEFQAIALGVETMYEVYNSLCGESVVLPINILNLHLFSDSMACLHWIKQYSVQFTKLTHLSVFVKNRLRIIDALCRKK